MTALDELTVTFTRDQMDAADEAVAALSKPHRYENGSCYLSEDMADFAFEALTAMLTNDGPVPRALEVTEAERAAWEATVQEYREQCLANAATIATVEAERDALRHALSNADIEADMSDAEADGVIARLTAENDALRVKLDAMRPTPAVLPDLTFDPMTTETP